jgi:hypothetical protein
MKSKERIWRIKDLQNITRNKGSKKLVSTIFLALNINIKLEGI